MFTKIILQEWKTDFFICCPCLEQLENVCQFRDLCIHGYFAWKNREQLTLEIVDVKNDELPPISDLNFVCFNCETNFTIKDDLEAHIKAEHPSRTKAIKKFKCNQCKKTYSSAKSLKKHKLTCCPASIEDDKSYNSCSVCNSTFRNKYLLNRHITNVHAPEKRFKCDQCERLFASLVYLNAHKRYHSGERKHICNLCNKGYITTSDLYHHKKIHANERAYRCQLCPKAFNTSSDLHKHKLCVHLDRSHWKYECIYCQKRFPLKTNLDTHTKTHTGERNFLCHLCDRKCINLSVLKRHIESHSGQKPFQCSVCLQSYKYQKSLDIHNVKVHGIGNAKIPERIKKHFCDLCPKSYFSNNKLQKHIRSHTGERPFSCPMCKKCFIDKSYIKQHLKIIHNIVSQ